MRLAAGILILAVAYIPPAWAQSNPVPLINQPLVPDAAAPGGPGFTLTVHGTGFVSGSVVNWNRGPRTTVFVSGSELTATINTADIATAAAASVTVTSPAPGGGTSNVMFFQVVSPEPVVAFTESDLAVGLAPIDVATGDFNSDGNLDLAVLNQNSNPTSVSILLGNGDGTFQPHVDYSAHPQFAFFWATGTARFRCPLRIRRPRNRFP